MLRECMCAYIGMCGMHVHACACMCVRVHIHACMFACVRDCIIRDFRGSLSPNYIVKPHSVVFMLADKKITEVYP